jgi:exodeoxyribonuclease VII small subunit
MLAGKSPHRRSMSLTADGDRQGKETREPDMEFEAALEQLEQIVDELEQGEGDLTKALARYEQGVRLLTHCHGVLDGAERSVALLMEVDASGRPVTAPFDATATAGRESPAQGITGAGQAPEVGTIADEPVDDGG